MVVGMIGREVIVDLLMFYFDGELVDLYFEVGDEVEKVMIIVKDEDGCVVDMLELLAS